MYRNTIDIENKERFGIEIEFSSISLNSINTEFKKRKLPVSFEPYHKSINLPYDKWYLDQDSSVTTYIDNKVIGGELSSRILTDNKKTWEEIKRICETLRENNAKTTSNTSTHITVDISHFTNQREFLETLYKVISIYEVEMNILYMGDNYLIRDTKNEYARNISLELINNYSHIDFRRDDLLEQLLYTECFNNRTGINLNKLKEQGLIEIRYPNGTLNEKTIQNYINFTIKLLNAINDNKFDLEELDYNIKQLKESYLNKYRILGYITGITKYMNLVETISTNSFDEEDFFTAYQKVLEKR